MIELNNAIYVRQNLIKDLELPQTATVVGLGGTGFWTAVLLAMSGVEELILIDRDKIELTNLNRLPLEKKAVGLLKTAQVKQYILALRDTVKVETHEIYIDSARDCEILRGAIFCCTDNLKSQQLICAYAKKNSLPYQRIGYDGTILNVSKTFPLSFKETNERGYTVTPSWGVPAVLAAAIGVSSKLYKELCIMDDIGNLHIQNSSHICSRILDDKIEEGRNEILDDISDHIPDDYGYCSDCSRIEPDDANYGYCPECEERYSDDKIEEIKEEARDSGFKDAIEMIESGNITDPQLTEVIKKYVAKKKEQRERKATTTSLLTNNILYEEAKNGQ